MGAVESVLGSTILWLGLCVLLLDFYDISLPRGDSVTVSGSMISVCVLLLGPWPAMGIAVGSLLVVHLSRLGRTGSGIGWPDVVVRVAAVLAGIGLEVVLGDRAGAVGWSSILLVPTVLVLVESLGQQFALSRRGSRPLRQLIAGNLRRQGLLVAAEVCVAALTCVLYDSMSLWSLVPVTALLMLIRQAYAMLLEIRETYHQTLQVLVDAAESNEPGRVGHSERVAAIARRVAAECRLSTAEIERISYAALLHDVHGISDAPAASGTAESVVGGVNFFSEVIPVLQVIEGNGAMSPSPTERDMLDGYIVALSSDIDALLRPEVAASHGGSAVSKVWPGVPPRLKARAVSAAVASGFPVPAID